VHHHSARASAPSARPTGDGLRQNSMAQRPHRIIDQRPGRRLLYPQLTEAPVLPALAPPASGSIIPDIFVPTAKQRAILHARFDHGDIVKIEAVAGSGKTSVLRTLVHTYANRGRVLYLVFSKALQVTESQDMTGADMHGTVSVATLDSLAWQHTQECHGGRVVPVLELSAEDVRFEPPAFAKVVSKTIERFAQSVDECITTAHVPRRLPPRPNGLPYAPLYVAHVALEVWSRLRQARSVITPTYDVCMKLFQLYYTKKVRRVG